MHEILMFKTFNNNPIKYISMKKKIITENMNQNIEK